MLQSFRRIARAAPGKPDYGVVRATSAERQEKRVGRCRRPLVSASRSLYGVGSERIMSSLGRFLGCAGGKLYRNLDVHVKLIALDFSSTSPARPLSDLS